MLVRHNDNCVTTLGLFMRPPGWESIRPYSHGQHNTWWGDLTGLGLAITEIYVSAYTHPKNHQLADLVGALNEGAGRWTAAALLQECKLIVDVATKYKINIS